MLQLVQNMVQSPIKWVWNNKLELTLVAENKLGLLFYLFVVYLTMLSVFQAI
jgi:hypothetical protein